MAKRLYVGGLPYSMTEDQLKETFAVAGTVNSASIIMDRDTGRSRGFGFVEMSSDEETQNAIDKLNNSQVGDRKLLVNEARPMADRKPGGFGGGQRGGFSRGGGGYGGNRRF